MADRHPTTLGCFVRDPCGLWHYHFERVSGTVFTAADDAVANRPDGAAWFWFNDTHAPMHTGDSGDALHTRWQEWRESAQRARLYDYCVAGPAAGEERG
jgi:hypothetical protein